ncbi:MAG TPA: hypothetical protein VHO03_19260 [Ignavibacteriales bacterium]|nr:hypothetical protein [Ignavibacteriales bacterium]
MLPSEFFKNVQSIFAPFSTRIIPLASRIILCPFKFTVQPDFNNSVTSPGTTTSANKEKVFLSGTSIVFPAIATFIADSIVGHNFNRVLPDLTLTAFTTDPSSKVRDPPLKLII